MDKAKLLHWIPIFVAILIGYLLQRGAFAGHVLVEDIAIAAELALAFLGVKVAETYLPPGVRGMLQDINK